MNSFKKLILDILFPINCLSCGKDNEWICKECLAKIPLKKEQVCPLCQKKITPIGQVCFTCRKKYSIDGVLAASSYKNKFISQAIHYYKYRFIKDLKNPLGEIMVSAIFNSQLPLPDLILPVPLHPRRLRWRGFNQAELLANYLAQNLTPGFEIPASNELLLRHRYTPPQMKIKNQKKRRQNILNAFKINKECEINGTIGKKFLKNKNVLLVDDVSATGSTLFECARALKKSGAKKVFGIVIAKGN